MFADLKTDASIQDEKDVLGGGGPLEADAYEFTIDMAYVDESRGGARNVNFVFKTANGKQMKITEYVTSGNAKGKKNYYETAQGERRYLPGFNNVNSIALLTTGKELSELEPETKTIKVWDWDQRKEVNKEMPVVVDLIGQSITLGVIQQIEDISQKNDQGAYVPTGYTRVNNAIGKIFRTKDHLTVAEIKAEANEAEFFDKWVDQNKGQVRDRSDAKAGHKPRQQGGGNTPAPAAKTETKSLFG